MNYFPPFLLNGRNLTAATAVAITFTLTISAITVTSLSSSIMIIKLQQVDAVPRSLNNTLYVTGWDRVYYCHHIVDRAQMMTLDTRVPMVDMKCHIPPDLRHSQFYKTYSSLLFYGVLWKNHFMKLLQRGHLLFPLCLRDDCQQKSRQLSFLFVGITFYENTMIRVYLSQKSSDNSGNILDRDEYILGILAICLQK